MVSSIGYKLSQNRLVTGFGTRRRTTRGTGIVRKTIGALSRPALTFVANKIADAITGTGVRRRKTTTTKRRTVHGSSFKPAGYGVKRRPRKTLRRVRRVLF